ncbi:MAG: SCP2 sterol-binding domain-containing protein [Pseudomonadota bacterium]
MNLTNVREVFDKIAGNFNAGAAKGMDAIFQFDISGEGGGNWFVEVKDTMCRVQEGSHSDPTVSLAMSGETWLAVVNRELNAVQAFMTGKLKVRGDIMLAQRIPELFSF